LGNLDGVYAAATDAGRNDLVGIHLHRKKTAANIRANIPRMIYEEGKRGAALVADQLDALSPQLYCQVNMIFDIISRALPLCAKRFDSTLSLQLEDRSEKCCEDCFRRCF